MKTIKDKGQAIIITNTQDAMDIIKHINVKDTNDTILITQIQYLAEKINADLIDIWTRLDIMVH
jgi:thymidine kinase